MPSVRHEYLKRSTPSSIENAPDGQELDAPKQGEAQGNIQSELVSALVQAQEQRAALAQTEITKLKEQIQQFQESMLELTKQNLPPGKLEANIKDLQIRLEEAEEVLARANEAKQNTELTSSLRQEHHEPALHVDHTTHEGHGQGPPKVGAVLGKTGAPTKQGVSGPRRKIS
jgi:hypothetical protein